MGTSTETPQEQEEQAENWFILMDAAWRPESETEFPPIESVLGPWPLAEEGKLGKFRSNPQNEPTDDNAPSDPLAAVLRLIMEGETPAGLLQLIIRKSLFDIACATERDWHTVHPSGTNKRLGPVRPGACAGHARQAIS